MPSERSVVTHTFKWKLPVKSYGRAVRIQLKCLYKLHILSVYIAQGDDFIPMTAADLEVSKESAAMAPPEFYKEAHRDFEKDMHIRPKTSTTFHKSGYGAEKRENNILSLTQKMRSTYKEFEKWTKFIKEAAEFFSLEELTTLRELVFLEACNRGKDKAEDDTMDVQKSFTTGGRATTPTNVVLNLYSADMLNAPTPRCNFQEVQKKIRQILLWVNTGQQKKKLGQIYNSEYIRSIASDSEASLGKKQYFTRSSSSIQY
jgi:hypothetical protein